MKSRLWKTGRGFFIVCNSQINHYHSHFCPSCTGFFMEPMKQPKVQPQENGKDWLLLDNYAYPLDDGRTVFVPRGFIFDFASIPRIAWRLFPPATGKYRAPALIHDWLCASGIVSWKEAADIFLGAMKKAKVPGWKRYTIYYAVRAFAPFHKPDVRQHRLLTLQRAELMQCEEHYSNVI